LDHMEEVASYKKELIQLGGTIVDHHCKEVAFHLGEDNHYCHHLEAYMEEVVS